jgi:hypothetical protein
MTTSAILKLSTVLGNLDADRRALVTRAYGEARRSGGDEHAAKTALQLLTPEECVVRPRPVQAARERESASIDRAGRARGTGTPGAHTPGTSSAASSRAGT